MALWAPTLKTEITANKTEANDVKVRHLKPLARSTFGLRVINNGIKLKAKKIPEKLFFLILFYISVRYSDWLSDWTAEISVLLHFFYLFLRFYDSHTMLSSCNMYKHLKWVHIVLGALAGLLHSYFKIEMILAIKELCYTSGATTGQIMCTNMGRGKKTEQVNKWL